MQQRILLVVLTLSMLAMILSASTILYHSERYSEISEKLNKVKWLASQIVYFDEGLTMSARMYTFNPKQAWLSRYDKMAIELDLALKEAGEIEPVIQDMIKQTSELNHDLILIETGAIEKAKSGLVAEAQQRLLSPEYLVLKASYSNQMVLAFEKIQLNSEDLKQSHNQKYQIFITALTLQSFIFIGVWFYLLNFLRLNNQRLHRLITTDELTGLHNRRKFDVVLQQELHRSIRDEKTLMLAVLDIDYFKKYNDEYGHPKGDQVLTAVGKLIKRSLRRAGEFGFRLGGEEFAIIATVETHEEGKRLVEKLMRKLESKSIKHIGNPPLNFVTISAGIGYHHADDIMTDEELYSVADTALYQAKEQGRNRLIEYSSSEF